MRDREGTYHFDGFVGHEEGEVVVADERGTGVEPLHDEDVPLVVDCHWIILLRIKKKQTNKL